MTDTYVLILAAMGLSLASLLVFLLFGQQVATTVAQSAVSTLSVAVLAIGTVGMLFGYPTQFEENCGLLTAGAEALAITLSPLWVSRLKHGTWSVPHGS